LASLTEAYSICPDAVGQLLARCRKYHRQTGLSHPAKMSTSHT